MKNNSVRETGEALLKTLIMENEKKWFAVYTRAKWERKVSELLTKRKVENFCPLNKVVRQWADRKKTLYEPLFNSYVFVYITNEEHATVRKTDGILNFVYWLGKPAQIKNEEMDVLKTFTGTYKHIQVEKINVDVNDRVKIINGPLLSREGNVVEVKRNSIKVLLPTLGYALIAEVDKSSIEVVVHNKQAYSYNLH